MKANYVCIEDYVMDDGQVAFIKGKEYYFDKNRHTYSELFEHDMSKELDFDLYFSAISSTTETMKKEQTQQEYSIEELQKSEEWFDCILDANRRLADDLQIKYFKGVDVLSKEQIHQIYLSESPPSKIKPTTPEKEEAETVDETQVSDTDRNNELSRLYTEKTTQSKERMFTLEEVDKLYDAAYKNGLAGYSPESTTAQSMKKIEIEQLTRSKQ